MTGGFRRRDDIISRADSVKRYTRPRAEVCRPIASRFTERGREVLKLALTEASHFNHDSIDPAHLLVGLLREERGVAALVLAASGLTLEAVRERLGAILGHGGEDTGVKPFTLRSKKILDLALGAARRLGDERADTEHLLLALASEPKGAAAKILADLGVIQRELRAQVMSFIGKEDRTGIVSGGSAMRIVPEPSGGPGTRTWI